MSRRTGQVIHSGGTATRWRNAAEDYPGAKRIWVAHPLLKIGCLCPKCLKGKLYPLKEPARLVRIMAQPIFSVVIYELERLRCALCGAVFTAPAPPEALSGATRAPFSRSWDRHSRARGPTRRTWLIGHVF